MQIGASRSTEILHGLSDPDQAGSLLESLEIVREAVLW
jgi:hypothetical protein